MTAGIWQLRLCTVIFQKLRSIASVKSWWVTVTYYLSWKQTYTYSSNKAIQPICQNFWYHLTDVSNQCNRPEIWHFQFHRIIWNSIGKSTTNEKFAGIPLLIAIAISCSRQKLSSEVNDNMMLSTKNKKIPFRSIEAEFGSQSCRGGSE
jgi:hypothetical protein